MVGQRLLPSFRFRFLFSRFKLHLAPPSVRSREVDETMQSCALPRNKTVIDVFADFMAYLHDCAQSFITQAHPTGESFWLTINRGIEYILTHPNGWGGAQQSQMRKAAVKAGLIPDDESGHARIHFVTEGEASLHYCIKNGLGAHVRQVGYPFDPQPGYLPMITEQRWYHYHRCWWWYNRSQLLCTPERFCSVIRGDR